MRQLPIAVWLVFAVIAGMSAPAYALEGDIVFIGLPFHRVVIEDIAKPQVESVPDNTKQEFRVEIVKSGKDFAWSTRGNKGLIYVGRSGVFEAWVAE